MSPKALIVAKAPMPGRTKTRLVPPLTPQQAADLQEALLLDTLEACRAEAETALLYADPSDAPVLARLVGPEVLETPKPRRVNHWRAGIVFEVPPEIIPPIEGVGNIRLPLMSGDIYTDRRDPQKFWQVLQFGIQNLYDAEQDEWIVIDRIRRRAGDVELPDECAEAATTTASSTPIP